MEVCLRDGQEESVVRSRVLGKEADDSFLLHIFLLNRYYIISYP
jgi:hypothetical protein